MPREVGVYPMLGENKSEFGRLRGWCRCGMIMLIGASVAMAVVVEVGRGKSNRNIKINDGR